MVVVEMVVMVVLMSLTVNMLGDSRRDIIDANNVAFLVGVCGCWYGCGGVFVFVSISLSLFVFTFNDLF
jgi:hypothetical protein